MINKFININKKIFEMAASNYSWKPSKQNNILLEIKEELIVLQCKYSSFCFTVIF